ncbi:MAG TPA: hypothetical protein VEP50_05035 [bacterium]|nr:hypothetical protein [bacterium]
MSKHREALRRGIRSLIQETSRELADLEGREAPSEARPGEQEAPVGDAVHEREREARAGSARSTAGPAEESDVQAAAGSGPTADRSEDAGSVMIEAEVLAVEVREVARVGQAEATPGGAAREADRADGDRSTAVPSWGPLGVEPLTERAGPPEPGASGEQPAADQAPAEPVRAGEPQAGAEAVAEAAPEAPAAPLERTVRRRDRASRKRAASRRGPQPARRRPTERWALDGVDPRQVHTRHGVCAAYFINPECWRVPDAHCNTALQVCAMRNCPVYHLHQETLERRFAAKYKHFW